MTTKEERLFLAIGAADPELLERSGRRRAVPAVRWALAAACLALLCTAALTARIILRQVPPPEGGTPPQSGTGLVLNGGDTGVLHLASICYEAEKTESFLLYVNEELYYGAWEGGDYVIRPITPPPEGLPDCDLTISHWRNVPLEEAAEAVRADLENTYSVVLDPEKQPERTVYSAYNGTESGAEWDAANACVTLVDDQEGGTFTLTARFFTEAAEGLGAGFTDMVSTFQPVPAGTTVPAWLTSLRETVDTLLPAVFSNDWTAADHLLTEGARISAYQEDVSDQVSISAVDISPDSDEDPSAAVVTVRHRLSAEEPFDLLSIELVQTGGQWKAKAIGLER